MKKNISINISGIIFHIEEDGYDTLKKYLDSINRYFSSFEDSTEILADIESRIAEIFLSKLNEGKQVITTEDVNALVATMGSVSDFKAAEEQAEGSSDGKDKSAFSDAEREKYDQPYIPHREFIRDQKRKILGGVCAGLARVANVDPVWIRLLFVLFNGVGFFIYIILWIVLPGAYDLDEPTVKKMYRDPERKALGGVAGGIAAYFGVDILAVRLFFIAFVFFYGMGAVLYFILWIILPSARSLTDRIQMHGDPVTLSTIDSSIKRELRVGEAEESTLAKVLLFPFRLIARIFSLLAKVIGPILDVVRVLIGVSIMLFAVGLIFMSVIAFGAVIGLFAFPWPGMFDHGGFPLASLQNMIPGYVGLAGFIVAIVPAIFILLVGLTIVNNRSVIIAPVGWTLFIALIISVAALAVGVPRIAYTFQHDGEFKEEQRFELNSKRPVFAVLERGMDEYQGAKLNLKGHAEKDLRLVQNFEAQGSSRQEAIENAHMISYGVVQNDSILAFDSNVTFQDDAKFRAQRVEMTLFIPFNQPFVMQSGFSRFVSQYIKHNYLDGYVWMMTEEDGLKCVNCNEPEDDEEEAWGAPKADMNEIRDFDELDISGKFDVNIRFADQFNIELTGPSEEREKYSVYKSGKTLVIDYEGKKHFNFNLKDFDAEPVRITITLPQLQRVKATGFGTVRFEEMREGVEDMEIEALGPVKVRGNVKANHLIINLTASAQADLIGKVNTLNADLTFAAKLDAYQLEAQDAIVEVNGASSAKVHVTHNLEIEEGVASHVDYRGNPTVIKDK